MLTGQAASVLSAITKNPPVVRPLVCPRLWPKGSKMQCTRHWPGVCPQHGYWCNLGPVADGGAGQPLVGSRRGGVLTCFLGGDDGSLPDAPADRLLMVPGRSDRSSRGCGRGQR
jgi:hypothetical protein